MEPHTIKVSAPAAGKRKGTTVSLRNAIVAVLDKELVITPLGVEAKGHVLESVTLTFNFQEAPAGKG